MSGSVPDPAIVLDGDVVVVTGAGTASHTPPDLWGIGAAVAAYAAAAGARVGVLDVDAEAARRTVDRIGRDFPGAAERAIPLHADVTDDAQLTAALDELRARFGPIGAVVNNVGIGGPRGTAADVDLGAWATTFDVNVTSMVRVTRAALVDLIATGGSVVNISSLAGVRGGHHALSYPTTKAAIVGLTQTMAGHHGPDGVRVNAVLPGLAYTPMVADRGVSEQARQSRAASSMLRVEGTAWDIAAPVAFLLSRAASWMTGVVLPVDAGLGALTTNLGVARDE